MKLALMTLALSALGAQAGTQAREEAPDSCAVCHGREGLELASSVHAQAGIGCTACHGGRAGTLDGDEAHTDDLKALTEPLAAVELCGQCHSDVDGMRPYGLRTDQLPLYSKSHHGQRLNEGAGADVASCVSCHGAHDVFRARDPRSPVHPQNQVETCGRCHSDPELMQRYELPADVPELYRSSAHGKALLDEEHLASPSCSDCHGSHGAKPPEVTEVGRTCGACHSIVSGHFQESPHASAVAAGSMEECVSCHGSHALLPATPEMFVGSGAGQCGSCHDASGDPASAVAGALHEGLTRLDRAIEDAEQRLEQAATRGLFLEREHGYLDEARGLRVRARPLTHACSPEALDDLCNRAEGMIQQTLDGLDMKYRGHRDRRILTSIFLAVVLTFALVLRIYQRDLFGPTASAPDLGPGRPRGERSRVR